MKTAKTKLKDAEKKAAHLFDEIENRGLIRAGITEQALNGDIFKLAEELFGIKKYWHKRIVRAGKNTIYPYKENPPDLMIAEDDILFLDFGPIFEDWEADFGRTFVIGNDQTKLKLRDDIETAWTETQAWFLQQDAVTGAALYQYALDKAKSMGWKFGGEIAGHLIGKFPHEKLQKEDYTNYVHPENHVNMLAPNSEGQPRDWILEIHFIDPILQIGGFTERLLTVN